MCIYNKCKTNIGFSHFHLSVSVVYKTGLRRITDRRSIPLCQKLAEDQEYELWKIGINGIRLVECDMSDRIAVSKEISK